MIFIFLFFSLQAFAEINWLKFSSAPHEEGAFPETNVSYYRYAFKWPLDKSVKIRIRGKIPYGRYMTFNIYDRSSRSSLGSFPDSQIISDDSETFASEGESYSLWLTPKYQPNLTNQIVLGEKSHHSFEVWYRIYLPEKDEFGGVSLPSIDFFEFEGDISISPPISLSPLPTQNAGIKDFAKLPPRPTEKGEVYFYATPGFGFYNNQDNQYLVSRLDFSKGKDYLLVSFKAPHFGKPLDTKSPDVRYFSFCLGSARTTETSGCISDQDFFKSEEMTHFLIGPDSTEGALISDICQRQRINFLPRGKNFIPLLIYRNVLPRWDFQGIANPQFSWPPSSSDISKEEASYLYAQHHHIGAYSPIGKHLSVDEVLHWLESMNKSSLN